MRQTVDFYDELIVGVGLHVFPEEHPPGSGRFEPFITLDSAYYAALEPLMSTARQLGLPVSVMVSSLPTVFSGPGNSSDGRSSSWSSHRSLRLTSYFPCATTPRLRLRSTACIDM